MRQVRYDFIRDAPDIASTIIAYRAELTAKIVMPTIVPHSERNRFLTMMRYENGKNGNPHFHGVAVGDDVPQLGRHVVNDVDENVSSDSDFERGC